MPDTLLNKSDTLNALPGEWPSDLMPYIRDRLKQSRTKIVVLDDDPTGTQTVHDIPVLTTWDADTLKTELLNPGNAFFILTNSRGLTRDKACELGCEIGENLRAASEALDVPVSIVSRSDSTLRGHFPDEVDAVAGAVGNNELPYLICPFFLEGGRLTLDNIHYVAEGEVLTPAARTSYARDAAFGFSRSNLCEWVEEKTGGRIPAHQVTAVTLEDIRKGGPDRVAGILEDVPSKGACIVNAASYRDMEVVVCGLLAARANGKHFLYRTAASFVRVRAGVIPRDDLISPADLASGSREGGLFVVGSYVPKTTAQVAALLEQTDVTAIEIKVGQVLDESSRRAEIDRAAGLMNASLLGGMDTLIFTSRELVRDSDPEKSLMIGQAVSASLIEIVRQIDCRPRYLVAKGGITSSDVATQGLGIRRAMVMGQALPGVPVWKLGEEAAFPGMPYIIFPGNVGEDDALARIRKRLHQSWDRS